MRVYSHGGLTKRHIKNHIGGFAAHTWQGFQGLSIARNFTPMQVHQHLTGLHQVFGLAAEKPDGFDVTL